MELGEVVITMVTKISKKKIKELFLLILFIFLFMPLVHSEVQSLGVFKTGQAVTLSQTSPNATFVNVTRVIFPNSTQSMVNLAMAQPLPGNFNVDFTSTQSNGQYIVTTCGDPDGTFTCVDYIFVINPLGKTLTQAQAVLYFLVLGISFLFFAICVGIGIYLPMGNKKDVLSGYILAVDNIKYLKLFFLCISYLIFVLMIYFGYIVCYAYLDMDFLGNLLYIAFYILLYLTIPLFIVGSYLVIANLVRDSEIAYQLSRGFKLT